MPATALGTRVRFRATGAVGDSLDTREQLPFDGWVGPWHLVQFDDGLKCWCTATSLEFLTVLGWRPTP